MIDLVDYYGKLKTRLVAEGCDAAMWFGRSETQRHDNQGPGTGNRIIVYPGTPKQSPGGWVRRTAPTKQHVREEPGKLLEWERVTIELWAYDINAPLDEAVQYRTMRAMYYPVSRLTWYLLRAEGHLSSFLTEGTELYDLGLHQQGRGAVMTFEVAFTNREPRPTADEFVEVEPEISSVVVTTAGTEHEEPTV